MYLMSHELKKSKRIRLRVLVCDDVEIDIIIGSFFQSLQLVTNTHTTHFRITLLQNMRGRGGVTVQLGDGVSMTYGSDGQTHSDRAGEERRIYAEKNMEVGVKAGERAQHSVQQ